MHISSWVYSLRQTVGSLSRSGLMSLASVATVAISLLVLSVILLLALNLEYMASTVESQVQVKVYLHKNLDRAQQQQVLAAVQRLPDVDQAVLVTKEEALERMKIRFQHNIDILAGLDEDNPLPDAVELSLKDPNQVETVASTIAAWEGVTRVDFGQGVVERLLAFTRALRVGGLGLVVLLVVATIMTISNTIRLAVFAHRREIGIMKLVGATDWFIRRPFVLEGIVLGALGAVVAALMTGLGYAWLVDATRDTLPFLPVVSPDAATNRLTVGLMALGSLLGAAGSFVSLRRFLKV